MQRKFETNSQILKVLGKIVCFIHTLKLQDFVKQWAYLRQIGPIVLMLLFVQTHQQFHPLRLSTVSEHRLRDSQNYSAVERSSKCLAVQRNIEPGNVQSLRHRTLSW
jgi:hypothetical protein